MKRLGIAVMVLMALGVVAFARAEMTPKPALAQPAVSPDGSEIAFAADG